MRRFVVLVGCLLTLARTARAHGGEDHGEHKEAPVAAVAGVASAGDGDLVEVLLKAPQAAPGQVLSFSAFVSDVVTNEPVADAEVELEFSGPQTVKLSLAKGDRPGLYLGHATFANAGNYALLATVTRGEDTDLVTMTDWPVQAAAHDDAHQPMSRWPLVAGALAIAVIAVIALITRSRKGAAALLLVCSASVARAHGGEVHPGDMAPSAPQQGNDIFYPKESQFLLDVRTAVVEQVPFERRTLLPGRVLPRVNGAASVLAPLAGVLDPNVRLPLPGERVTKGQLVAVVEQTLGGQERLSLSGDRIRLESELSQADAQLSQAQSDVQRLEQLEGVVAQKDLLEARTRLKQAKEERTRAARSLELFGKGSAPAGSYGRSRIVAPITGIVSDVAVGLGQQVEAGGRILGIVEPSVVWVEASVFPTDAARLTGVRSALVRVDGLQNRWFPGRLLALSPVVDPATQSVRATFEVRNDEGLLRPGLFAEVAVGEGTSAPAVVVPDSAVVESEGRRFVFVKLGPEYFTLREVLLGARDGERWEVRQGLAEGEKVVVRGTYQLRAAKGGL